MKGSVKDTNATILETLRENTVCKQEVYNETLNTFKIIKKVLKYLVGNFKSHLKDVEPKISLDFKDMGMFEAEMQIAGDLLVFNMHSNVFEFPKDHWIRKTEYVKQDSLNGYCGIINIYNFISDSFKYNRLDDYGFIIARIFINREGYYFVEGNPNFGSSNEDFAKTKVDMAILREIIQYLILHVLEVDLVVPDLKDIQFTTVAQMKDKINKTKMETGKPLGFRSSTFTETK